MRARKIATTPLCTLVAAVGLAVIYLRYISLSFEWEAEQLLIRETGILAFTLFSASFLCTPLRQLAKRWGQKTPNLVPWRRSLGLVSALVGCVHVLLTYSLHVGDAPIFGAWFQPYAQAGAAAFLLLMALAATSFSKLNRRIKIQHWKTLHRLVFVIFFLLLLHIVLGPHLPPGYILGLLTVITMVSWAGRLNP